MWGDVLWEHIKRYHELVTNGLDLLSFLLITPEIVRHIGKAKLLISFSISLLIASYIIYIIYVPIIGIFSKEKIADYFHTGANSTQILYAFFGIAFTIIIINFGAMLILHLSKFSTYIISNYMLAVGVVLFFAARLVAFAVAAHEAFAVS